jgi:isoleucyl-tRNA synthetase
VRQPLAELKVQPGQEADRRAVQRFADQLVEELNVKKVTLHEPDSGPLLRYECKPNMKNLGPKFGPKLKDVQAAILNTSATDLAAKVQAGQPFELNGFTLDPTDVVVSLKAPDGWAGVADRGTQALIDARLTPELQAEGMARDVIRQVQQLRKDANLQMEDRIVLYLHTESATLRQATETHRTYIANETLTVQWVTAPLGDDVATASVKIEGQALTIQVRKAAT